MASLIAFMPCLMILSEAAECMYGNGKGVTVCSGTQVCAVCGCSSCLGQRAGGGGEGLGQKPRTVFASRV